MEFFNRLTMAVGGALTRQSIVSVDPTVRGPLDVMLSPTDWDEPKAQRNRSNRFINWSVSHVQP